MKIFFLMNRRISFLFFPLIRAAYHTELLSLSTRTRWRQRIVYQARIPDWNKFQRFTYATLRVRLDSYEYILLCENRVCFPTRLCWLPWRCNYLKIDSIYIRNEFKSISRSTGSSFSIVLTWFLICIRDKFRPIWDSVGWRQWAF